MANPTNSATANETYMNLNASNAMMTSMAECFTIQHSMLNIPNFDGKNVPLKDFLQDIQNGSVYIPPASEGAYVKALIGKLKGAARDSTFGKTFNTVNDLIKHLKSRFASGKTYPYYHHEIESIRMKRGESVNDFYDRLNILISGARVALEDKYGDQAQQMLQPVKECALDAFLRGLPDEIARAVDARDPKDLEDALKFANRVETRMKSGILPSNETTRLSFLDNLRPSSPSFQNHRDTFVKHNSDHRNYTIVNQETHSRTPSPTPSTSHERSPTGILKPSRAHQETSRFPCYPPYSPFYPYFYPPMPPMPYAPPYTPYPYHAYPQQPQNFTQAHKQFVNSGQSSSRSRSPSPLSSRSQSPSGNYKSLKPGTLTSHDQESRNSLNYPNARRNDATTGRGKPERQVTVKFLENEGKSSK